MKDTFLQLRVTKPDMPALSKESREKEPDAIQCLRRPFRERSAPSRANYVVQINAERHRDKYPEATEAIRRNLYVYDSLNSVGTESEAIRSNTKTFLNDFPASERVEIKQLTQSGLPISRDFGVVYCANTDTFHISVSQGEPARIPRAVLSRISSMWYPHGWFSAFTIRGRICQRAFTQNR